MGDFMAGYSSLKKQLFESSGDIGMSKFDQVLRQKTYTQVLLTRRLAGNIYKHLTRWVPSEKAVVGEYIEYEGSNWLVAEKYSSYPESHVLKYPKEFKIL
jgi:hypothetical protein